MQIIVFTLGEKQYAIPTDKVEEIIRNTDSTKVPNSPNWVEGLINLRGNVVTLLNLNKLLYQEDDTEHNNIIIINDEETQTGLLIEDVVQVMDIEKKDIQSISEESKDGFLGVLQTDDAIVNIIDIEILLNKNEG